MKTFYFFPVLFAFISTVVFADTKIAVVDIQRILREAAPAVRASKKLEKEFEPKRLELQRFSAQGKSLQQLLDKNTLTEADRRVKERELVKLNQDFQRMQREINEDLNARRNEEMAGLQERVNFAIRSVAETDKLDIVIQDAVYRNPKIDVTEKVLKLLADK
ncbi:MULTISPECIES: OmpH family outer membrane protein [Deefgea]|uniref:OmpH family outer membrane protein n=1 Tax=Deefgea chitinilytica TaxID=570276 RepID=A0ABS2C8N6_9NEIS|nr:MULTISPECIES: OmpH family outer membrane protein [Deefgea]MBM5570514.1 OmpH family outer membrane protein [Deefgea chitinilytica]MBM9887743.1 OmpH family outer membrane protein [Deefgea sp. CFH1-16]